MSGKHNLTLLIGLATATAAAAQTNAPALRVTTAPVAITPTELAATLPTLSPDGQTVAFSGANFAGLWLTPISGGTVQPLTDAPGAGWGAAWSPSGRFLAARLTRTAGTRRESAVTVFAPATGQQAVAGDWGRASGFGLPSWTGDDQILRPDVPLTATVSAEVRTAANPLAASGGLGKSAAAAPTGFVRPAAPSGTESDVLVVRSATGPERTLTPVAGRYLRTAWSADGRFVALHVLPTNGTDRLLLVQVSDGKIVKNLGAAVQPTWVGDRLVFARLTEDRDGHQIVGGELYAVRSDGTGETALTATPEVIEQFPSGAASGGTLVYQATERDGTSRIWRVQTRP